jgi:hypothetical protein
MAAHPSGAMTQGLRVAALFLLLQCLHTTYAGPLRGGAPPAPSSVGLCFHQEDTEDHKCFEACNVESKKFSTKGIELAGQCPSKYNTVDSTKTVLQCPDGVTNVRYCAATALNVTIATKGEAGEMAVADTCPGSASSVHAACQMSVTFTNSCDEVRAEVAARAKGSADGSWTDPHNKGIYTIKSDSTAVTDFAHLTGNKKYTDKVRFTYSSTSNGGCQLEACSESQVFSVYDAGTNFCNINDLFCGDGGCHVIKSKLAYTEKVGSCSGSGPFTKATTADCYKV